MAGIGQYWLVDPETFSLTVLRNNGDGWDTALELDADHPTGEVTVSDHGAAQRDLCELLLV